MATPGNTAGLNPRDSIRCQFRITNLIPFTFMEQGHSPLSLLGPLTLLPSPQHPLPSWLHEHPALIPAPSSNILSSMSMLCSWTLFTSWVSINTPHKNTAAFLPSSHELSKAHGHLWPHAGGLSVLPSTSKCSPRSRPWALCQGQKLNKLDTVPGLMKLCPNGRHSEEHRRSEK